MTARSGAAVALLAALPLASALPGRALAAPDRVYAVGAAGWTLERFGSGLAVLRAPVTDAASRREPAGSLLLTCEGHERRLVIDLPGPPLHPRRDPQSASVPARLLVGPIPASPEGGFEAALSVENGRRAILSDGSRRPGASAVRRFARLLRTRPERLNLLIAIGPANLARDIPVHLVFTFGPRDAVVLDDIASTCDPGGAAGATPPR